jgi:hypothetical protein
MREANWNLFSRKTRLCFGRIKETLEMYGWSPKGEVIELAQVLIKCALEEGLSMSEFKEIVQTMLNIYDQLGSQSPSAVKPVAGTTFACCAEDEFFHTQPLAKIEEDKPALSYQIPERRND